MINFSRGSVSKRNTNIRLFEILTLPIEVNREMPPAGAQNLSSANLFHASLATGNKKCNLSSVPYLLHDLIYSYKLK